MPTLYRQLKKLPWAAVPAVSAVSTDHGRRARRTIKAVLAPAWIEFDGAAQVAQLRRTVTKNGKKTVEVVYLITSDRDADPATLAAWVRGHWEIENRLHWVYIERQDRPARSGQIQHEIANRLDTRYALVYQALMQLEQEGRICKHVSPESGAEFWFSPRSETFCATCGQLAPPGVHTQPECPRRAAPLVRDEEAAGPLVGH